MRSQWLALALATTSQVARAQTRADSAFLRVRQAAIDIFEARSPGYEASRDQKPVIADLERRLRQMIGRLSTPGFQGPGRYYPEFLCHSEEDCGELDALSYKGPSPRDEILVTTTGIMSAWLEEQGKPRNIASALRSPETLNSALGSFATIFQYDDLRVPDGRRRGVVSAWLARRGDDIGAWPPEEVLVTMMRRDLVYIIQMGFNPPDGTTSLCGARYDSAWKTLEASGIAPQRINADSLFADYRRCFADRRSQMPGIDSILSRVTKLVDVLKPGASTNYGLSDREALEGRWRVADARARMSNEPAMLIDGMVGTGSVEFGGDTIRMRGLGHGDVLAYAFTLDTAATPRRIRMVDAAAPDSGRWVGLYRVSGDTLRLSLPIEHFGNRPIPPASFNAPNTAAYIFTRVPR